MSKDFTGSPLRKNDIVKIFGHEEIEDGFYEVTRTDPLWIHNDYSGSYNGEHFDLSGLKLVCNYYDRKDFNK